MAALDDLKAAAAKILATVEEAKTKLAELHAKPDNEADIAAVAAQLDQASASLEAAVNPPAA